MEKDSLVGWDDVFGDLNRLQTILMLLDERGLILSLAAFAEEALGDLIYAFMIPGEPAKQLIEGFNAPIGTLSARIRTAFALGLITKNQYEDLDRLRKIRNEFAHRWEPISFADQKINSLISAMYFRSLDDEFPASPTAKVQTSIGTLLTELRSTTHQIKKHGYQSKLIGRQLIAGVAGELDHQIATCRARLEELAEQLKTATGEQRRFLVARRYTWESKLEIVRLTAPSERKDEIRAIQVQLHAWHGPSEDLD